MAVQYWAAGWHHHITSCRLAISLRRAMRWWALAGRQWRTPRAHRLPWRESSSSSFLRDDPGACLYSLLGLDDPKATRAEIKHAFRSRARALHPDAANDDAAVDAFVRVVAAYEILSCSRRRAAYDATRRAGAFTGDASSWGGGRDASSSSSSSSSPRRQSPFDESETFRTYAASIDALVPRWRLRDELHAALAHVIHGGTQLDVAEVESGAAFPRYFEAEERAAKVTATRGVDLMHVVAGRTLLAAVRERVDAEITAGRGEGRRMLEGDVEEPATTTKGELDAFAKEEAEKEETKEGEEGNDGVDARLELVVGGRIVATATRRRRGGDVTVFDARRPTAENENAENEKKEASLLRADVNNWGGHPRAGTAVAGDGTTSDEDAYASRGARGEAFTISGLRGSFDRATVFDADGAPRHVVVAHATPGVTHLHWFDAITGVCVGRGTRAWVPPSDLWLFAPRSDDHDAGGWYFELPPGAPNRGDEPLPGEREPSRRLEPSRGGGREPPQQRHVFDEFVEDFERGLGFKRRGEGSSEGSSLSERGRRRGAPLPPAAALFTAAFRLLDRERGEDHGVGGAVRRAWASVFGSRY